MSRNTTNILLGIGGSGARCVEAFLHLAAVGIGPTDVSVCIVDQDAANGNSADALSLLSQLSVLQAMLKRPGKHLIPNSSDFLNTAVKPLNDSGFWSPSLLTSSRRPYTYFRADSMEPASRALFDSLYSKDEQRIELDEGYHGRPNIGAAVLTANVLSNDDFLKSLVDNIIAGAGAGQDVRIFLVGSIFGGTGAAGFPTIARLISRNPDVARKRGAIKIGGAILLPYFHFTDSNEDDHVIRARAATFLRNSEGALRYYDTIENEGGVYDALYVIGLDPYLTRRNLGRGGKVQVNPPMLPEMLGALAAVRHFSLENVESDSVHISGREKLREFGWEDLPPPTAADLTSLSTERARVLQKLGTAVRFAFSYSNIYRPALQPGALGAVRREAWYQRHLLNSGIAVDGEAQSSLTALDAYLQRFLKWIASMTMASEVKGVFSVKLFDVGRFAEPMDASGFCELKSRPRRQDFPLLIFGREDSGLEKVLNDLTYEPLTVGGEGLGEFVASLHHACRLN